MQYSKEFPMKWFAVRKTDLPSILERSAPESNGLAKPKSDEEINVGFAQGPDNWVLSQIIINDRSKQEVLAWIATFASEIFPLSQVARLLSWQDFSELNGCENSVQVLGRELVWPSLIIGETLAQGEASQSLQSLPLSRITASFSYCQARSDILYGRNNKVSNLCAERLEQLESERSFIRRPVGVRELRSAWNFVNDFFASSIFQKEWIRQIIEITEAKTSPKIFNSLFKNLDISVSRLAQGGVEERVLEFERAVENFMPYINKNPDVRGDIPLVIAGLCFLVGGGTSHITLLDEYATGFPAVYLWFGLLAGLAGPTAWDSHWARSCTSVERQLRAGFRQLDPPSADICWAEYEWIASQRVTLPWLRELPKLYPRLVSIEVFPGATCQLRLADADDANRKNQSRIDVVASEEKKVEALPLLDTGKVEDVVRKLTTLLADVQALLPQDATIYPPIQPGLFGSQPINEQKKPPRKRASKKST